jgi:hypothetical protein
MTMTDVVINDGDNVNMIIRCNQTIWWEEYEL